MRLWIFSVNNYEIMRTGVNRLTNELEIYLDKEEAEQMQQMVRGASLTHRRTFYKLLEEQL